MNALPDRSPYLYNYVKLRVAVLNGLLYAMQGGREVQEQ
jgi:hypothetical protein